MKDTAGATLNSAIALAAIPAIVTLSMASVSAGGALGLLGITAGAVVFKQLAFGIFALALLWLIASAGVFESEILRLITKLTLSARCNSKSRKKSSTAKIISR